MGLMSNFYNQDGTLNYDAFNSAVQDARQQIALEYPVLGKAQSQAVIGYSPNNKYGGYLEYYPASESENPYLGKTYQEVYDKLLQAPKAGWSSLKNALAADMTHYTGGRGTDDQPNDPKYMGMQQSFEKTFTPKDQAANERSWQRTLDEKSWNVPDNATQEQLEAAKSRWFEASRTPGYIRGALWNQWDGYQGDTPEQKQILSNIKGYLTGKGFQNREDW